MSSLIAISCTQLIFQEIILKEQLLHYWGVSQVCKLPSELFDLLQMEE